MLRRISFILAALLVAYATWWLCLQSPERQVTAVQMDFLEALEGHDWKDVEAFLAPDFVAVSGHTRGTVMPALQHALGRFVTLSIEPRSSAVKASATMGLITQQIRLVGLGDGLAMAVRDRANQITTPWLFHWRKTGRWPWNWQLTQVHNDTAPVPAGMMDLQ